MNRSWVVFGVVALIGLGCAGQRTHYDYESIVRARRSETQTAPARQASGVPRASRARSVPGSEPSSVPRPEPPDDSATPQRATGRELSLAECIDLALAANPDIGVAIARIRQSEAVLDEARAPFLPSLSTSTEILGGDSPSLHLFKAIDSRTLDPGTDFNYPGTFGSIETGVSLRYNLYNGGRDRLRRWMAATGRDLRELGLGEARNSLTASVIRAFYDIQAQTEMIVTANLSVKTVRAQYDESKARMDLGSALRSDVLSLKVRLAEAEERVIRAVNAKKLTLAALANLLGEDADSEISLTAEDSGDWSAGEIPEQYELAVAEAMARRPELLQARAVVENAAMNVSEKWRGYLPRADGAARVYWTSTDFDYSADRRNWFAGVTLSWNLFEGGSRKAQVARARSVLDEMLHADRKAALAIQLDVKTAYLRIDGSRARLEVADASVEQAEEGLSLVRSQYDGGTATITRYLEAELMATRARMRHTSALYDLKKARADAARAMGWLATAHDNGQIRQIGQAGQIGPIGPNGQAGQNVQGGGS